MAVLFSPLQQFLKLKVDLLIERIAEIMQRPRKDQHKESPMIIILRILQIGNNIINKIQKALRVQFLQIHQLREIQDTVNSLMQVQII